jgi:hypothetical protein
LGVLKEGNRTVRRGHRTPSQPTVSGFASNRTPPFSLKGGRYSCRLPGIEPSAAPAGPLRFFLQPGGGEFPPPSFFLFSVTSSLMTEGRAGVRGTKTAKPSRLRDRKEQVRFLTVPKSLGFPRFRTIHPEEPGMDLPLSGEFASS